MQTIIYSVSPHISRMLLYAASCHKSSKTCLCCLFWRRWTESPLILKRIFLGVLFPGELFSDSQMEHRHQHRLGTSGLSWLVLLRGHDFLITSSKGISKGYSKNNRLELIGKRTGPEGPKSATLKTKRQGTYIGFSLALECHWWLSRKGRIKRSSQWELGGGEVVTQW